MESARTILQLQKSASEAELLDTFQRLTVQRLKFMCKETAPAAIAQSRSAIIIIGAI